MRTLNNKDIKTCTSNFEALITNEIYIEELFGAIDEVMFEYVNYLLERNESIAGTRVFNNIYYMKRLRDLFIQKPENSLVKNKTENQQTDK